MLRNRRLAIKRFSRMSPRNGLKNGSGLEFRRQKIKIEKINNLIAHGACMGKPSSDDMSPRLNKVQLSIKNQSINQWGDILEICLNLKL
jgi:hypothetical protein